MTAITVTHEQETPGIGGPLKDKNGNTLTAGGTAPVDAIPAAVVAQQSLNVDGVTGATVTSAAVRSSTAVTTLVER